MSPLIAVAGRIGPAGKLSRLEVSWAGRRYLDAVIRAGGEPVTLAPRHLTAEAARVLVERFDGLLLMGGADVDPGLYGQDPHERTYGVDRRNDEYEIALSRAAAELGRPTLAICRGMQVANVAFGGTLHQHLEDITTEVAHGPQEFPKPLEGVEHPIDIAPGSQLAKALEGHATPPAVSYHHQAVDELGDGFTATAWSDDGHVEAMEREDGWFVCLQWHPEDTAEVDASQQRIYDTFVEQARAGPLDVTDGPSQPSAEERMPRWVGRAIFVFWAGFIASLVLRWGFSRLHVLLELVLVSLFLSFAIEPGVNRLARRGWRRGSATATILLGVFIGALGFVVSIGALMFRQVADVLNNSDRYITRTVNFLNDTFNTKIDAAEVQTKFKDPDGPVQRFIRSHSDDAVRLSVNALGFLLQMFSVLLVTFYLVADGPRMRRAICSRLRPGRQATVLNSWNLAIDKTGGYLYSRVLLAGLSALFHWIAFQIIGVPAPVALALWVGIISQFIPVVGTYIAGVLPVVVTLVNNDSPIRSLFVLGMIVVYQQIENYIFAPRITARTLELHPAIAFMSALAGAALLGPIGAVLGLPAAAMVSAIVSEGGPRHELEEHPLIEVVDRQAVRRRRRARRRGKPEG